MPKISKESAPDVQEYGPALDISGRLEDYTVNFVTIKRVRLLSRVVRASPVRRAGSSSRVS